MIKGDDLISFDSVFFLKKGESNSYLGFASGSLIDFNLNLMSFQKLLALEFNAKCDFIALQRF